MNRAPDVELVLREWLAPDGDVAPDRVLEVVADRIALAPRRHVWRLRGRTSMNGYAKLAAGLAAALLIAIAGWQLLPGPAGPGGRPSPSPSVSPSPSPSPGATQVAAMPRGPLNPGTYATTPVGSSALRWQVTVPSGWTNGGDWYLYPTALGGPGGNASGAPNGLAVAFLNLPEVVLDGCDFAGGMTDTSTVADLVAAIQAKADWVVSTPTTVTIGGFSGRRLDVALPADLSRCGESNYTVFGEPGTEDGFYAQGPGQQLRVWVLDVAGRIVILQRAAFAATPANNVAEADQIIESSIITP